MSYDLMNMLKKKDTGEKRKVTFIYYRKGFLYYTTECGFEFPVPVDDTGDATFNAVEEAPMLMRYIRKHISNIEKEKASM